MSTMNTVNRIDSVAQKLRNALDGQVYLPGEIGFEEARVTWNLNLDPHPTIITETTSPQDIRTAILAARDNDLPFAIQSTGHGTVLPADGGLLVKTSRMSEVWVNPERQVARVGPGALWRDVIEAAAPFGLAPLSGSSSWVGVAGYTLGGGAGLLSRKHGYAADSLISADVVTADGDILTAYTDENPDLFWAMRGGSGNFGVVTSMDIQLFPVTTVYAGMSYFAIETAADLLTRYREWTMEEPDEMSTAVVLMQMPDMEQVPEPVRGRWVLGLRVFYDGDAESAQQLLAPLFEVAGEPLMEGIAEKTFAEHSADPPPPPMDGQTRFDLIEELSSDIVSVIVDAAKPPISALEIRHWGGAMARSSAESGPTGHRDLPFSVAAAAMFDGSHERGEVEAAVGNYAAAIQPHVTGGSFLNFLTDPARTESAYTPEDYRRLTQVKRRYDPDNVFRLNHNIPPSD